MLEFGKQVTSIKMIENKNVQPLTDEEINKLIDKEYSEKTEYTKEFIKKVILRFGNNFEFYKTNRVDYNKTKVIITCKIHGDFVVDPQYFISSKYSYGCPLCQKELNLNKRKLDFIENVKNKFGKDRYDLSNINYINESIPITGIKCSICGDVLNPILSNNFLKRGKGCSCYKSKSKGEVEIEKWLINNNINFTKQYKVPENLDILNGRSEKSHIIIDFRILYNNKEYWIECNGEQHYTWVKHLHNTIEKFESQLRRDINIRNYCKDKNIILIEIPIQVIGIGNKLNRLLQDIFINSIIPEIKIPNVSYTRNKKGGNNI